LSLQRDAFSGCSSLSRICIPRSVERLCYRCFYRCDSLWTVTFESGSRLSSIEEFAFKQCTSLSSICIPSSVRNLSELCFAECISLATIGFESPSNVLAVGGFASGQDEHPVATAPDSVECVPGTAQTNE
jgi:hypothetical protein